MTLDEQIKILESNAEFERRNGDLQGCLNFRILADWLKDYKKLLEKEPCDDAISRSATLDAIIKRLGIKNETYLLEAERVIYQQILAMPSVTQQPKMGQWIGTMTPSGRETTSIGR